ncbi:MAG: site-specific tyrosine recombinase/integron integrase [Candidatus Hodarchaeota archaeon]
MTSPPIAHQSTLSLFSEWIEDFLITKRLEEGRSENTIKAYKHDLTLFFKKISQMAEATGMPIDSLDKIKIPHVKRFLLSLSESGYTKVGLARKIATLKSFFNHLHFMGHIKMNPLERIRTPKISRMEHLPKFLTQEEINKVLKHARHNYWIQEYVLLRFLYATMCRVSELCNVKVKDVDFNKGIVRLRGKGNKERWVPVDQGTLSLIKKTGMLERKHPSANLFINKRGGPIQPRVVQSLFQRLKRDLRFSSERKLTPHVFRHTGATLMRRNGMDISELQDLLGHSSPNTTRIYAKNDIEKLNESYKRMHPLNMG